MNLLQKFFLDACAFKNEQGFNLRCRNNLLTVRDTQRPIWQEMGCTRLDCRGKRAESGKQVQKHCTFERKIWYSTLKVLIHVLTNKYLNENGGFTRLKCKKSLFQNHDFERLMLVANNAMVTE